MTELDRLIAENHESFNRLEPKEDGWNKIAMNLPKQKSGGGIQGIIQMNWWVAAVLVIGLGSVFFLVETLKGGFENDTETVAAIPSTLEELQDVTLLSPHGKPVTFDPTANRFTLVQFWSSGSAICTEDACYYYLPAYEKYKDFGFEIYAISVDEDHDAWVNAIEENQLPWTHASDLKGYESPVCVECNITSVPTTFLLNHRGDIVARDLEASELEETLDRLYINQDLPF